MNIYIREQYFSLRREQMMDLLFGITIEGIVFERRTFVECENLRDVYYADLID